VLELFELRGAGCHLSAEEVHQQLVNLKLKVSLATVYRTLRLSGRHGFSARAGTQRGGASV
jgi:Fur family ferric uptake transcriptional regulator